MLLDPDLECARDLIRSGAIREGMDALAELRRRGGRRSPYERAVLLAALVDCRLARGDLAEAMSLGDDLTPLLSAGGTAAAVAHHAKGELAGALGDPDLALAHYLSVGQLEPGIDADIAPWRAGAALASMRTGDPRGALVLASRFVDETRIDGRPHIVALALRTLAAVDPGSDRIDHLRAARAALQVAPQASSGRLAAQIDTDLAGLLLLQPPAGSGHDEMLALLRSAEILAGRQELWPLQSRIRRHLERLDVSPRRVDREAAALLTAAERRVCRLAIDGMSNRRIAEDLGVSIKAVEWHLGHVYRKLAISSRIELGATLGSSF